MTLHLLAHDKSTQLRERVTSIKASCDNIFKMKQIHSNIIHEIPYLQHTSSKVITIPQCDGLITTTPNTAISVTYADCLPIVIYQPSEALCILHAGRKGTEQQILKNALIQLNKITSKTKKYTIIFGPHIHERCYEIKKSPQLFYSLKKENLKQLHTLLKPHEFNIELSSQCTCCTKNLYSYRGENKTKKRNRTFAYFTKKQH